MFWIDSFSTGLPVVGTLLPPPIAGGAAEDWGAQVLSTHYTVHTSTTIALDGYDQVGHNWMGIIVPPLQGNTQLVV